jgi:GT2 family glycosyltransferase
VKPYCSVLMASYNRPHLLKWGLESISRYSRPFSMEIVVVNDGLENDGTFQVCQMYPTLNIKYVFAGCRNSGVATPRNPGIPNNIAFKQSSGEVVILTCPEIYHVNEVLNEIVRPLSESKNVMSTPDFMYLDDGRVLKGGSPKLNLNLPKRRDMVEMPFCLGLWREKFDQVGGYDEDMTGYAGEDNDLVNRLVSSGLSRVRVPAEIIHLFHGRVADVEPSKLPPATKRQWQHNYEIAQARKNILVRNAGREWGKL